MTKWLFHVMLKKMQIKLKTHELFKKLFSVDGDAALRVFWAFGEGVDGSLLTHAGAVAVASSLLTRPQLGVHCGVTGRERG